MKLFYPIIKIIKKKLKMATIKEGCFWGLAILKFALCLKMRGNAVFWKFVGKVKLHLLPITCRLTVRKPTSEFVL